MAEKIKHPCRQANPTIAVFGESYLWGWGGAVDIPASVLTF